MCLFFIYIPIQIRKRFNNDKKDLAASKYKNYVLYLKSKLKNVKMQMEKIIDFFIYL